MIELSLCPCCGGAARFGILPTGHNAGGEYVECTECGLSTNLMWSLMDDAKRELAQKWNRRHKVARLAQLGKE